MILYQLIILSALLVFLGIVLKNLVDLHRLPEGRAGQRPMVSVLVPSRNEEGHIAGCVQSLLSQDYGRFEVIVLDDQSTDGTWRELEKLAADSAGRLRFVKGEPLPDGWHGKAWACHQLSGLATGELMLFTDADTRHRPDALRRAVAALEESGADMLSLTPSQEMNSFWEKLIIPLIYHILCTYLPIHLVSSNPSPAFCYAIGQFILFRRESYLLIDGHRSVRRNLVEDVELCKMVKRKGGRVVAFDGTDAVSCRMYAGFRELWNGFSKNLFAGLGYNASGLFVLIALMAMLYLAPYGFVLSALYRGELSAASFWLPVAQISVAIVSRMVISLKFRQPLWPGLLHGWSQVMLILIAINSFRLTTFGKGPVWKGRSYQFQGESE